VLVACSFAFRLVEIPKFRAFLYYLNNDVLVWLPKSHNIIRRWLLNQYDIQRVTIKRLLDTARSKIHISFDLWSSPNHLAIFGIIAHFISSLGKRITLVLTLKELKEAHTGVHMGVAIQEVLKEWQITKNLGYFQMDNATNNDSMIDYL
jgi:hypothetical protein